jgi:hypothetical protein
MHQIAGASPPRTADIGEQRETRLTGLMSVIWFAHVQHPCVFRNTVGA